MRTPGAKIQSGQCPRQRNSGQASLEQGMGEVQPDRVKIPQTVRSAAVQTFQEMSIENDVSKQKYLIYGRRNTGVCEHVPKTSSVPIGDANVAGKARIRKLFHRSPGLSHRHARILHARLKSFRVENPLRWVACFKWDKSQWDWEMNQVPVAPTHTKTSEFAADRA